LRISVVVPVLNEAGHLAASLAPLAALRARGHEVIVADGGSTDGSAALAASHADRLLVAARGRARQMNAGAGAATGDVLLFLHADTRLPDAADLKIAEAIAGGRAWGRFDVRLSGSRALLRVVERMMSLRSCLTGIATGDQGIFVRRPVFLRVGGFPAIPLMEDIALSRRLRRAAGWPACVRSRVVTSSRRWERDGVVRTVLAMWVLRAAYALGADPWRLAAAYYGKDYAAALRTGEGAGEG
jgi:rSAM/selenodomain-associated transferase 2